MSDDTNYTKLKNLFKEKNHVKLFDGLSTHSSFRGAYVTTTGTRERFSTNYVGSFAFLDNFLRNIKKSLENLPAKKEDICNEDIGYQFPTSDDVKKYIDGSTENELQRTALRNNIINIDEPSLTSFINNLIDRIKTSQRATYIAGKIGSGKSTFINMITTVYKEDFINSKTIVVRLNHEDFEMNDYIQYNSDIDSKHHIEKVLYSKIAKSIVEFIKSTDMQFDDYTRNLFHETYKVDFDTIWNQTDENLCKCTPSLLGYLSERHNERDCLTNCVSPISTITVPQIV